MVARFRIRRGVRGVGLAAGLAALLGGYAAAASAAPSSPAPATTPVAEQQPLRLTAAEAAAYATKIGQRVEIGTQRAERRTVYANPDGTTTAIEHTQPVRVVRDGTWVPVDATLAATADGGIAPKAATFGLRLSAGGNGPLLTAERAGRSLSLQWPGALPKPVLDADRATYAEVLPGVDLVVNVTPDSFSHVIVIKNAKAAANPRLAKIELGLQTTGAKIKEQAPGNLTVADAATGKAVFEAPQPTMWDSPAPMSVQQKSAARLMDTQSEPAVETPQDTSTEVPLGVEVAADSVTLLPDRKMLADPATTFPVYIDPVYSTSKRSAYAMVASGYENEAYWSFKGKSDEGVGECPVSSGTCAGVGVKRLFYTVPTPYVGMDIISAKFAVTMVHTYDGSAKGVSLYRAGSNISSSTKWSNQPALSELMETISPTAERSACETANQNVRFNVAGAFDNINSGKLTAITFGMRAASETDHTAWKRFCGNGQLEVTYNRKPAVPATAKMSSAPGGTCATGTTIPTLSTWPTLYMYVTDPDHSSAHKEDVRAQVLLSWKKPDGTPGSWSAITGWKAGDGATPFQIAVPNTVPQNVEISWQASGGDTANGGNSWSAYSSPACKFIIDTTAPPEPDIDSAEFLPLDATDNGTPGASACQPDQQDRGWAGLYSTFVFDAPGTDAVRYLYGFDEDPKYELIPKKADGTVDPGGPVTKRLMPDLAGTHFIKVRTYDKANNPSQIAVCYFGVPTRAAVAEWSLGDTSGSAVAADSANINPIAVPSSVTLGVSGPGCAAVENCQRDQAARFTGATTSYLATTSAGLIDTGRSFATSAWVKLTDNGQERVVVSQDSTGQPGFTLGLDGATKKWAFKMPTGDVLSLGDWVSASSTPALTNVWTHLAGVYDADQQTIQLYVDGAAQPAATRRSQFASRGAVQIGRSITHTGYRNLWKGDLADVALYDRVVSAKEMTALVKLRPTRIAYWQLNTSVDGYSPEYDKTGTGASARDLLIEGGASIRTVDPEDWEAETPLLGSGELILNGVDGRARTSGPVVPMDGSFVVSAHVRLASDGCTSDMSVLSQAGAKNSGFRIRCTSDDTWQLVVPNADTPTDTNPLILTDPNRFPSGDLGGQHLAVVYDAFSRKLSFYVGGELAESVTPDALFNATGGLQAGRALIDGVFGEYLAGAIDDVRVYSGTVDATTVALLAQREEQPNL
ncbi:LamG domain-containing protein [Actinoplanes regularis]|uniref:LamG domain-containing protein n=1 Tax=Actinoplanes regularis TaxID=52697 RepID=UPI00255555E0|nr:LamG domain-containing protein [Actinoplanes regularis]